MNINSDWHFGAIGISIVGKLPYNCCYIAGNLFATARARLIGYFEVTLHITVKLFPAKISYQSMTSEGNFALLPANVDRYTEV